MNATPPRPAVPCIALAAALLCGVPTVGARAAEPASVTVEAGRAELDRNTFLRWVVSSYNIGNAVGIWCYYGSMGESGYRNVIPTSEDIDAALRLHVRLWRQGMSWGQDEAGSIEDFDREYYSKVEELRREYEEAGK